MKKQTVPRFSVALAMKNKTPFDMTLKVFVSKKINFFNSETKTFNIIFVVSGSCNNII